MPPSERITDFLQRWNRRRREFPTVDFVGTDFDNLRYEEFDGIDANPIWNRIRQLSFLDLPELTRLPPFPTGLEILTIENTGVGELPPLPASLEMFDIKGNANIRLPNKLPDRIRQFRSERNNLEEIPEMPTFAGTQLKIEEPNLVEPFRGIYQRLAEVIHRRQKPKRAVIEKAYRDFFEENRKVWADRRAGLRERGRNTKAALSTTRRNVRLPESVANLVSGFVSGKRGTTEQQLESLRGDYARLTRGGGKTRRRKRV